VLGYLMEKFPGFMGVMGWELYASLPNEEECWMWPFCMRLILGLKEMRDAAVIVSMGRGLSQLQMNQGRIPGR
jgi:hypothetical protein